LRSSKDADIRPIIERILTSTAGKDLIREDLPVSQLALARLAEIPITGYNKTRLLIDGQETLPS